MKRDMDLARTILMQVEAAPNFNHPIRLSLDGYDAAVINYHVKLLAQADLLEAKSPGQDQWFPLALTWQGHEFLDAARDDKNWNTAKGLLAKAGGFTLDVFKSVLVSLLRQQVELLLKSMGANP